MKKQFALVFAMTVSVALSVVFILPRPAHAHGQPVIVPNAPIIAAGDVITITGSDMEAGEVFTLTLEGISGSSLLGSATAIAAGEEAGFTATFTVPESIKPGTYTLKAATADGDGATTDLTVTPPASQASAAPIEARMASGELHAVERPRSVGLLIGVIVAMLISGALGIWLAWPRKAAVI